MLGARILQPVTQTSKAHATPRPRSAAGRRLIEVWERAPSGVTVDELRPVLGDMPERARQCIRGLSNSLDRTCTN